MFKRVAITGGIGSGKSVVCKIIKEIGLSVYSADETYSELICDENIVTEISKIVGVAPLYVNGKKVLDRKSTSEVVFSNKEKLKELTDFTNEKVLRLMFEKSNSVNDFMVFYEVPLLFENGFEKYFDYVIILKRSIENRVESLKLRNNFTKDEVLKRVNSQFNYDLLKNQDNYFYILNDYDIDFLKLRVNQILGEIIEKKSNI